MTISVIKRDGRKEILDIDKIHKVIEWACEDLPGVSVSEVELASHIQFYDKITTKIIHETMIKAAADLISEESPNYQYVAARLVNYQLRKEVYGKYIPDHLYEHWLKIVELGYYDDEIGGLYSEEEWDCLNSYIDHNRDNYFVYAAMEQLRGKYLVKNRITNQIYETPQLSYMLIAMNIFKNYDKINRLKWVKDLYDGLSNFDISFPTPIMSGVRTTRKQYSSCTLIESDDSLESITATATAIVKYVSQKAGIGIGGGRIRALGSPIRRGDSYHTGVIPFYKHFQTAVGSCSQGSIRSGKATLNYPLWHLEIEDMLVLKNNKGTDDNRIRQLDYCVQLNKVLLERFISNDNITLFCPNDVPDLYDAFFADTDKFRELYEKYERSTKIRKKVISAQELISKLVQERKDTGRIYIMFVDNVNDHGPYLPNIAPIKMTNLCTEITQPTKPLKDINDPNGLIALCTLAAINMGKIRKLSDLEKPCTLVIRALNCLLDEQFYPVLAAENHTMKYRPLGVGIINFAYWMVRNDNSYETPELQPIHELFEAWSYYLIKASIDLAEETGPAPGWVDTKYHEGIFPIDSYKKDVDQLVAPIYNYDWEELRSRLKKVGIKNCSLMAQMPSETSSQISNSTNSFEPPRNLVSVKQSKDGVMKQVVPDIQKYKNKYELLWEIKSPEGYLKIAAIMQKFYDQALSVNTSYNPQHYENNEIPLSELIKHILLHYKWGGKTLYYHNTYDGAGELNIDNEQCDSCVI